MVEMKIAELLLPGMDCGETLHAPGISVLSAKSWVSVASLYNTTVHYA